MLTEHYSHKLAAIFPDSDGAELARKSLVDAHLDDVVMMHLHGGSSHVGQDIEPEQAATRNHFVLDILAGTGIGALFGIVLAGLVAVIFPTVFSNVPVLGPLMVIVRGEYWDDHRCRKKSQGQGKPAVWQGAGHPQGRFACIART